MNMNTELAPPLVVDPLITEQTKLEAGSVLVYEVNLVFQKKTFEEHKEWMLEHIDDMVKANEFTGAHIYQQVNMDPTNDAHMREYSMTVHYYIDTYERLKAYLEKQARNMRSQVVETFADRYMVWRRVFVLSKQI